MLHPLTSQWALPATWRPLGALAFKLEEGPRLRLKLGGQTSELKALHMELKVQAAGCVSLETDLYALH